MDKKKPLVGGALNMVIPGLAQIYIGRGGQAVVDLVGFVAFFAMLFYLVGKLSPTPWPEFVCPGLVVISYFALAFYAGINTVQKFNTAKAWGKCPYCKETINIEAKVCAHCGRDLGNLPEGVTIESAARPKRKGMVVLALILIGLLIVLIGGALLIASGALDLPF
jgi:hypothetical protein